MFQEWINKYNEIINKGENMEEKRMKIDFSKNGEGRILMSAIGASLYLDETIKNNLKIGDKVEFNNKDFKPLAQLNFYKVETIDILIEKLIAIKNNLIFYSAS